jgi:hypothetical protein
MSSGWFAKFCNKFSFSFSVESIVQIPAINSTRFSSVSEVLIQTVNIGCMTANTFS